MTTMVNMISFGTYKPPPAPMTLEFCVINKIKNEDGLVLVKTNSGKEMWLHPDQVNDVGWETGKSKPSRQMKKQLRNLPRATQHCLAKQEKQVKEVRKQPKATKASNSEEPSKSVRSRFTLADFIVPISRDEDEPVISNYNRVSSAKYPPDSDDEDNQSHDSWDDPLVADLLDDDEYLSYEIWAEEEDPYFFDVLPYILLHIPITF